MPNPESVDNYEWIELKNNYENENNRYRFRNSGSISDQAMQESDSLPASYNIEAPFWVFVFLPQIFLRIFFLCLHVRQIKTSALA